jgi:hypothetical protein
LSGWSREITSRLTDIWVHACRRLGSCRGQHTGCRVPHVLPLFLSLPFRKWCCALRGDWGPRTTLQCASDGRDVETLAAATGACPPHPPPRSVRRRMERPQSGRQVATCGEMGPAAPLGFENRAADRQGDRSPSTCRSSARCCGSLFSVFEVSVSDSPGRTRPPRERARRIV